MSQTEKLLNDIGVVTSFNRIETYRIPEEYRHQVGSLFCYRLGVTSEKNKSAEQFFIPRDMQEVSDQLSYVVRSCTWRWDPRNTHQINHLKLKRIFKDDFSELLHHLLVDMVQGNKDSNLLALALAEFPEASEKTLRFILTGNFDSGTVEAALRHSKAKNLVAFF